MNTKTRVLSIQCNTIQYNAIRWSAIGQKRMKGENKYNLWCKKNNTSFNSVVRISMLVLRYVMGGHASYCCDVIVFKQTSTVVRVYVVVYLLHTCVIYRIYSKKKKKNSILLLFEFWMKINDTTLFNWDNKFLVIPFFSNN